MQIFSRNAVLFCVFMLFLNSQILGTMPIVQQDENWKSKQEIEELETILKHGLNINEIKKIFPVPTEWENWYQLKKEKKLPANIKIISSFEAKITAKYANTAEQMIEKKIEFIKMKNEGIFNLHEEILEYGSHKPSQSEEVGLYLWLRNHTQKRRYNPYYFEFYVNQLIKKHENPIIINMLGKSMWESIIMCKTHPIFFVKELEYLKKYIPKLWGITNNNDYNDKVKIITLGSLYLLNESVNSIIKTFEKENYIDQFTAFPYLQIYLDYANSRVIYFYDVRLEKLYAKIISSNKPLKQIYAFEYFHSIGKSNVYFLDMVTFVKSNLDRHGLRVFKLLSDNKNTEVKNLAIYLSKNLNKIDIWAKPGFKNILENSFGYNFKDDNYEKE